MQNLNDRLFGKQLNEAKNIQFPMSQMAAIYRTVKPLLTAAELQDFNNMSANEKIEYLNGFAENILEWKNAKNAANSKNNQQQDSGNGMQQPNDGLDHWIPAKMTKEKNSSNNSQSNDNSVFSDIQEELNQAEKEAQQAQQNAEQSNEHSADIGNPQKMADNAKSIADSAQQMADAAQSAADQAQNAADNADANAQQSGVSKDIRNADKSQTSADAAQDMAKQAQAAANKARKLADEAQEAADNGDLTEAARKTKEAFDAAKDASNKTKAAQINAKDALRASKQTDPNNGQNGGEQIGKEEQGEQISNQQGQGQQGNAGEGDSDEDTDPTLQKVDNSFNQDDEVIHKKPISLDMPFDGGDFVANDQDLVQRCREMAERAGQPLDADDYISPQEYASRKFQEAKNALKKWKEHNQPGAVGNPPGYVVDVMDKLFATKFDWRDIVRDFMTDKSPEDIIDVWSKRRMGLPSSHPFYKGRYLHPYEDFEERKSGIAQVFFLVDASGSMSVVAGDGVNIFEHIMSELVQIEMDVKIQRSAYATFNAGHIYRDDIFTWTYKDAMDEESLLREFKLPIASGGTSAVEGIKSIQEYEDVYSTNDPWTLLIVVTDGGDYYSGLKDICKNPEQVEHMLWIITAEGESYFEKKKTELEEQGVDRDHIVCVDINKEWGVDESMVKKYKK